MRRFRGWLIRLGGMFRKEHREAEFAAELDSHVRMHIEDAMRSGMTPEQARRES